VRKNSVTQVIWVRDFYVETLTPNLSYPVEYKRNIFGKVNATYRADQLQMDYDYDLLFNSDNDEDWKEYEEKKKVVDAAANFRTKSGISKEELDKAINELAKKYPGARFKIQVQY